jgi:hypothetical protein
LCLAQVISEIWRNLSKADKQPWFDLADTLSKEHRARYPNWSYKPSKSKSKVTKRQNGRKKGAKPKNVQRDEQHEPAVSLSPMEYFDMEHYQQDGLQINTHQEAQVGNALQDGVHPEGGVLGANHEGYTTPIGNHPINHQTAVNDQPIVNEDVLDQVFGHQGAAFDQDGSDYDAAHQTHQLEHAPQFGQPEQSLSSTIRGNATLPQMQSGEELDEFEMEFLGIGGNLA